MEVFEAMEADVGGLEFAFGGCGKEPMLTVFRMPLVEGIPEGFSGDKSGVD